MAHYPNRHHHFKPYDRFASQALFAGANALKGATTLDAQDSDRSTDPIDAVKMLIDGSNTIHEQPDALLEASNTLAESGYHKLAAEAALEAMTLKPYDNYNEWYIHINRLLATAIEQIDAYDEAGNVIGPQLVEAARCARLRATSPVHKLILQEQDTPVENQVERAKTAQRELAKIVITAIDLARGDDDVRGFANETTQQACLLSKDIVADGNIVIMAPSWADQTWNSTFTSGERPSPNRDLLIYNRNFKFGSIQAKSTRPTTEIDTAEYGASINVIYANEILAKALREKGIPANRLYDFWQIVTDVPKDSTYALLEYFGPILFDTATAAQPHQRKHFANNVNVVSF